MENASSKTHASRSACKKRGMRSFSQRAALPSGNQLRVALDSHRAVSVSLTGLFRKAQPSGLWDLEDHLTRRRKEINYKYDSRGSRLTHVLGKLLYGGRLDEERLRGLGQERLRGLGQDRLRPRGKSS
jgi:hypothetical protein